VRKAYSFPWVKTDLPGPLGVMICLRNNLNCMVFKASTVASNQFNLYSLDYQYHMYHAS
jgi:hypothetical protein